MENIQKNNKIWIAWEVHRRTIELNKVFNAKLFLFKRRYCVEYPLLLFKSWLIIHSERPKVLIVQNPSLILTLLACILKNFYKCKLIVDAHNAGLFPLGVKTNEPPYIYQYLQRKADITIVTNDVLADIVKENGGKAFVLPDRIPDVPGMYKKTLKGKHNIMVISTFGEDEPYAEMIKAATGFKNDFYFYVTGNYEKSNQDLRKKVPSNLIFTGFLSDEEYWNLLYSVDLMVDLTMRENCLVCGAYEAVAAGTPMVLSDTHTLRTYFYKGAVFSENNVDSIVQAIKKALESENRLRSEVKELKHELRRKWDLTVSKILRIMQ